jgi:L-threonylcarbamoyladenylate synthase
VIAVQRIYQLKGRAATKPAAVMFFDVSQALDALPELGERTRAALAGLLPGPVTLLLPNPQGRFPLAAAGAGDGPEDQAQATLLGLRVPILTAGLTSLESSGLVALQSSANLSGGPDPRRLSDVPKQLLEGAEIAIDGGELPGVASTVIDLSSYERDGQWRIVRAGLLDERSARAALSSAC